MKQLIYAVLGIVLLLVCVGCGTPADAQTTLSADTLAPSSSQAVVSSISAENSSSAVQSESIAPPTSPAESSVPASEAVTSPSPEISSTPEPEQAPEPTVAVDPVSKLLPNIFTFLYHDRSPKNYQAHGKEINCNGSHPGASFEGVRTEILALLADEQYQLELVDNWINPHYSGSEMHDYFYLYTGTAEGVELLTDKYEEHQFHVMFRITYYTEYDYFKLSITYSNAFDLTDPGTRTVWDMEHNGEGGLLTAPPDLSTDSDSSGRTPDSGGTFVPPASRLDCLTCKGDGDCNTCGGDGYTGFGSAKAGCHTCHGNGKCRACGGSGKR